MVQGTVSLWKTVMIGQLPGEISGGFPASAALGHLQIPPLFPQVSPLLFGWAANTGAVNGVTYLHTA